MFNHPSLLFTPSRHFRRRRFLCTLSHTLSHPIYTIWASNTGLGKTLVSTGIAASTITDPPSSLIYIKPLQTGFPLDSDADFLYRNIPQILLHRNPQLSLLASNLTLNASLPAARLKLGNGFVESELAIKNGFGEFGFSDERKVGGGNGNGNGCELICKTMYAWKEAISPHLAAEREGAVVGDSDVLGLLKKCLEIGVGGSNKGSVLCLVETAGGVASPGSSGSLQCDLYRPFRLPCILVGDGKLGGISGTISAYESLTIRGYDVDAIVLEDHGLENEVPLLSYLRNRIPVLVLPSIPKDPLDNLMEWFDESRSVFDSLKEILLSSFQTRTKRLHEMPKKAQEIFWWPFTQHKLVPEDKVTVIDSRCGENFAVHKVNDEGCITQMFDACASWWTQGPSAALQIKLARDIGYTAARFGHVMFPENVYEPALEWTELLLQGVGKGWASRVYFSDNGSTAIEIAFKMAFRKFLVDNKLLLNLPQDNTLESRIELKLLKGLIMEIHWVLWMHRPHLPTLVFCNNHVIQGAGGMLMVDPLFQRILVKECKIRNI